MANVSSSNLTSKFSNTIVDQELSSLAKASYIISIIFNSITCPFTVLLNVLVILAVKSRPRLQSKPNILLACLAVTDAMNGLSAQPAFIFSNDTETTTYDQLPPHFSLLPELRLARPVRLFRAAPDVGDFGETCSDQIYNAIPVRCHKQKHQGGGDRILDRLSLLWTSTLITDQTIFTNAFTGLVLTSCVLFILVSYVILYRETRRHENKIKTGQLPQEEKERFLRDRKALKTTVYVVGAVLLCLTPAAAWLLVSSFLRVVAEELWAQMTHDQLRKTIGPTVRTFVYLNSLINPLIYCWRQKEMR